VSIFNVSFALIPPVYLRVLKGTQTVAVWSLIVKQIYVEHGILSITFLSCPLGYPV